MSDSTLKFDFVEPGKGDISVVKKPLDIKAARKQFADFEETVDKLIVEVEALGIENDNDSKACTELLVRSKTVFNAIEKRRKEIIKIPDKFVRSLNAFVKPLKDKLLNLEKVGKRKIGEYAHRQEIKRRAEERRMREEQERKQKELDALAADQKVDPVKMPEMVAPVESGPIRAESGTASTTMVWKFELIDLNVVPRKYLQLNEKAVRSDITAGIREIDGLRIFEEPRITIKRSY